MLTSQTIFAMEAIHVMEKYAIQPAVVYKLISDSPTLNIIVFQLVIVVI